MRLVTRSLGTPLLRQIAQVLEISLYALVDDEQAERASYCADAAEIAAITSALTSYDVIAGTGSADVSRPVDMAAVQQSLEFGWQTWQAANYKSVCLMLPILLRDVHAAAASNFTEASQLVTLAYRLAAAAAHKLGAAQLAWIAADRGINIAERTGNDALVASTGRTLVHAYMAIGQNTAALNLSVQIANRIAPTSIDHPPALPSAYGMLLLKGSIAAARAGQPDMVRTLQGEATEVAERIGEGNHLWSAFGPTNVAIHRVSAQADMRAAGTVIEAARCIDPAGLAMLPRERRAHHLLDQARGYAQWGKKDQALSALLTAESLAAEEIRCRPSTRKLITHIVRSYGRGFKPPASLTRLAGSIGVQT
ncbi:MAG: hypothetical protein ACRER3_00380 [Pseudomonas fluorescens]